MLRSEPLTVVGPERLADPPGQSVSFPRILRQRLVPAASLAEISGPRPHGKH